MSYESTSPLKNQIREDLTVKLPSQAAEEQEQQAIAAMTQQVKAIKVVTQAEYDALVLAGMVVATTLYLIK